MIQLRTCASCEKVKVNTLQAELIDNGGNKTKVWVCVECASSPQVIIQAFKKLTVKEKDQVVEHLLHNHLNFKTK